MEKLKLGFRVRTETTWRDESFPFMDVVKSLCGKKN